MAITYTVAEYSESDSSVEVTYTNDSGFVHKRYINIPKNGEGAINEEYFNQILEDQLRGVEHKVTVGAVTFSDPNIKETAPGSETTEPAPTELSE